MDEISAAEEKLGITLIAFSDANTKYAELDANTVKEIKELEAKLGLSLVALKVD